MLNLPEHAFFCREPYHLMQALLYAFDKKERTDIFILTDKWLDREQLDLENTDLIRFRYIREDVACVPITLTIMNVDRTYDDVMACRCLYNNECTVHAFPPAARYSFTGRDDYVIHDTGDRSYWRHGRHLNRKTLTDAPSREVRRIELARLPDEFSKKRDWKVRVWDFNNTLKNLNDEDRQMLLRSFRVPEINPGEKSLLFMNKPIRATGRTGREFLKEQTSGLLNDLQEDGWEVWFKEHPYEGEGVNAVAHNLPPTRVIPGSIPVELLAYTAKTPFTATVSVRCHGLESLPSSLSKTRRNGLTGPASREMGTNREADPTSIHLRGLQKIATTHLSRSDVLKKWFVLPEVPHDSSHDEEEEDVAPPGDSSD